MLDVYILPGVDGGLRLLLNIESYEHMRGSNIDTGIKVGNTRNSNYI